MKEKKARSRGLKTLLDLEEWRPFTLDELRAYVDRLGRSAAITTEKKGGKRKRSRTGALAIRTHLRPVDIYCYLRARFGRPNGFQTFIKPDDSDALIHWDYHIKAGKHDLYFVGFTREVHILSSFAQTDEEWQALLLAMKADYARVGKEKSEILKSLEKWVIFPNKYNQLSELCAELHVAISELVSDYEPYKPTGRKKPPKQKLDEMGKRASVIYGKSVQLSLLTPVVAEAFLNMLILMLCKPEIKADKDAYDAFVRGPIHEKILSLHEKCNGFSRPVDPNGDDFKNYMRIRDKRNDALHGNIDPERDGIDEVYFEGKVPLFKAAGDNIGMYWAMNERRYAPREVMEDYEQTQLFLAEITMCLTPKVRAGVEIVFDDQYPGYDVKRKVFGRLFPDYVVATYMPGTKYDDELRVKW